MKYYPDSTLQCSVYAHCELDLGDITLGKGHGTPMGYGQQCVKYYPDLTLQRSYSPDTDFRHICTVTLTLEI